MTATYIQVLALLVGQEETQWKHTIFWHETVMNSFHVVLHFVRPREFFRTDRAWKDLPLVTLMIEERMTLEAIFIFECFLDI
jgi:hypothetical protein